MKKIIVFTFSLFFFNLSFAQTDCGPYKVIQIQTQENDLLVLLKYKDDLIFWKQIGSWSKPSTKPYLAILMQAYGMKKNIAVRYWNTNYNCNETDYVTVPAMVKIF